MEKRHNNLPILIVSGASGFIGKYLIESLRDNYFIYALARRSQKVANIAKHKNIQWIRIDITNEDEISKVFQSISDNGGAHYFFHLAGYYDFEYKNNPEYNNTNVIGTENILKYCKSLHLNRFIFSSSQAILDFSNPNRLLNEESIADAKYPYAKSKQKGEKIVKQYSKYFPCSIVRLSAIYSDWCEYLPLYALLTTWLSKQWDRRILVGKGNTSIQYLHINDLIKLFSAIINKTHKLPDFHLLNANPRNNISHNELFKISYNYNYFHSIAPLYIPKWFAAIGILFRIVKGTIFTKKPFERLWMLKYVDKELLVDASKTCTVLNWVPTKRYDISRRLLFIIDKMKSNPHEWHYRNKKRLFLGSRESEYLRIYETMVKKKDEIIDKILKEMMTDKNTDKFINYHRLNDESRYHCVEHIFHMLEIDVRTGDRSHILEYAQNLAEYRFLDNFPVYEVISALTLTTSEIIGALQSQNHLRNMKDRINDEIAITLQMVIDEIIDTYEHLSQKSQN